MKLDYRPVLKFIIERERIRQKRLAGEPPPWTKDPILQNYRFTNVRREDDKVTIWIRENWRTPNRHSAYIWFGMCVARYINWPPTLEAIGYPTTWQPARVAKILCDRQAKRQQVFGGAYFLNSIGPKIESIVYDRLTPLWKDRKKILGQLLEDTHHLRAMYDVFHSQFGFGSFMAGQVTADLRYVWGDPQNIRDWWSFAVPGPGSKRGLNRISGRPVNAPWCETDWIEALLALQEFLNKNLVGSGIDPLHAQDVQGIACCEWDKYCRAKLGEGRPKTKFDGGGK